MKKRFELVIGTVFVMTLSSTGRADASGNPFMLRDIVSPVVRLAENASTPTSKPAALNSVQGQLRSGGVSILEGKCGEGKCGSQRVRQMMDRNGDNRVSHSEYNQWINRQAGSQFDRIDVDRDGVISRSEMSYFDRSN